MGLEREIHRDVQTSVSTFRPNDQEFAMSSLRARFVSAIVLVPSLFAGNAIAQESGQIQHIRDWAANVVRGDAAVTSSDSSMTTTDETTNSVGQQFLNKGKGFLAQIGDLVEQRIGWLRPTNVKEQALIWMAIAMALPWGFVSWLRPILKNDILIVRLLVVGSWTGIALWSAWNTWGVASGADRFTSTMLFGVPLLVVYFNSVARTVASPAKA